MVAFRQAMYRRPSRIVVLDDNPLTLYQATELLKQRDYVVMTALSTHQARRWVSQSSVDLLVVDVRLRDMSGLEFLAIARGHQPTLSGVLVGSEGDQALENSVWQHGASLIIRPYDPACFLMVVAETLASVRRRQRWPRKTVYWDIPVRVAGSPARLLDVSYGGFRFALDHETFDVPSPMTVEVPDARMELTAHLVWSSRASDGVSSLCGAALSDDAPVAEWRSFVDWIPQPA